MGYPVDPVRVSSVMTGDIPPDDDLALVDAALCNPDDFAQIYRRYVHQVYSYALSRTGSANRG